MAWHNKNNLFIYILGGLTIATYGCFYFLSSFKVVFDYKNNFSSSLSVLLLLLLAFFFYLLVFYQIKKSLCQITKRVFLIFAVLFCLILVFQPIFDSSDILYYVFYARSVTHYHDNPFITTPSHYQSQKDPEYCQGVCRGMWADTKNTYGPLWLYFTLIPSYLAGGHHQLDIILLKFMLIILFIISGYLIYKILDKIKPAYKEIGAFLFLWNPFIVFEVATNGRNEILLIFLIILHVYLLINKKMFWSFIVLLLSFLVKYVTLPLLALYILYYIFSKDTKNKILKLCLMTLVGLLIVVVSYWPVWEGPKTLDGILARHQFFSVFTLSPLISFFIMAFRIFRVSHPIPLSELLGLICFTVFSLYLLFLFIKSKKGINNYLKTCFLIILSLFLFALSYTMPWNILWALPFLILLGFSHWFIVLSLAAIVAMSFSMTLVLAILFFTIILLYFAKPKLFRAIKIA